MKKAKTTLSTIQITYTDDLYKIVDSLNRTLKHENYMFGLAMDEGEDDKAIFSIYRT